MKFDNAQQKNMILSLIEGATVSGKDIDIVYKLKHDVLNGEIIKQEDTARAS